VNNPGSSLVGPVGSDTLLAMAVRTDAFSGGYVVARFAAARLVFWSEDGDFDSRLQMAVRYSTYKQAQGASLTVDGTVLSVTALGELQLEFEFPLDGRHGVN